eukprot:TRINITY_DN63005_c0_g1_i1.p1 TRINITY_DN63005_c0_g1~~TRINITY_DN63005_c0_g1_i1.p1  ORF type:complete len:397 (-),score=45.22 TRINITY_DN63005_c0_g1_i1:86-1276(-)
MALAGLPRSFVQIRKAVRSHCETVTLGELLRRTRGDPKSMRQTGQWLKHQLPIRFARRIEDMLQLPYVVVRNPNMKSILDTYTDTFEALTSFPDLQTDEHEAAFVKLIQEHLFKHNPGTRILAEGYREVRRIYPDLCLDKFLHELFTTRIATRILMDNYVEMRRTKPGFVGVVCQGMRPWAIVQDLSAELIPLTQFIYGIAPTVEFRGNLDCVLDYIPRHVKYMVREILKNAFRSTVERHLARQSSKDIPPVIVELQQGDHHVIIKISDQGGAMPKQMQQEAWRYGWTTVRDSKSDREASMYAEESCTWDRSKVIGGNIGQRKNSELAGFGFGLPLTRLHAQYFGGDVFMQALPGHGTDMYLILTHLKEGTPSTEIDDLSTILYAKENSSKSIEMP